MRLTPQTIALAAAVLAAAVALDWLLRRLGRRLPRALARRGAARAGVWGRVVGLAVAAARVGLWTAAAIALSVGVPTLAALRAALAELVDMGLHAPLFSMSDREYSAVDVVTLPALMLASWAAVSLATRGLQSQVLEPAGVERSVQDAVGTIARMMLTFVATVVVLQAWGVDVRSLAILGSVIGVGIGFGLQHMANNLVSGLVLARHRRGTGPPPAARGGARARGGPPRSAPGGPAARLRRRRLHARASGVDGAAARADDPDERPQLPDRVGAPDARHRERGGRGRPPGALARPRPDRRRARAAARRRRRRGHGDGHAGGGERGPPARRGVRRWLVGG
jgi:hypothetical protein